MRRLFGTDGVRGVANEEPMTGEMAMRIGRAAAYLFRNKQGRHRIVVGKDTRLSGSMLPPAHSRDCLYHRRHAGGCGGGDLRFP
jgi:phosphoglucosamine mutase